MTKKNPSTGFTSEILYFSPEFIDVFMQAVKNASKRTMITNKSIFKKNDMEVEIYDTRAFFLIEVGEQYEKLLQKIHNGKNNPT